MQLAIKRVYDAPSPEDGRRILVDRLWPRGLKREQARIDDWIKDLAPSHDLRKWFAHDPTRWASFTQKYKQELQSDDLARVALSKLRDIALSETVTLVYAAKDEDHNNAVVLQHVLSAKE